MPLTPKYCGSCGSDNMNIINEQATCNVCGTTQGRFQEMIVKGYNDKLWHIELDTVIEDGIFNDPMIQFMAAQNIKFELIKWNGPGGGNPIIRFTGHYNDLAHLCTDFYQDGTLIAHIEQKS